MSNKQHLLIVDDEQPVLNSLERALRQDFSVHLSLSGYAALQVLREQEVAVIVADQRMPEMTGVEFFEQARPIQPDAVRIMLTGYSDSGAIIDAVNTGQVYQYLQKPWEPDQLLLTLRQAAEKYALLQENRRLTRELELANQRLSQENIALRAQAENRYSFGNIIGNSPAIKQVLELTRKVIPTDTTVLITGPTGTGKELIAQAIHYNGPRSRRMLAPANCAALPDALLESTLFGHKKGAFTDAHEDRKGLFELADGGTVFLDEIADTSPAFQQRLLRVLQEGEVLPVGGQPAVQVDVRVISATNRNLEEEVEQSRFRRDLYYRLNVFPIEMPSLSQRIEDIPLLTEYFIERYAQKMGKNIAGLDPAAELALINQQYSGNIRQLENMIERAVVMAPNDGMITSDHLSLPPVFEGREAQPTSGRVLQSAVAALERQYISSGLKTNRGNIAKTARELGLTRAGLYKKMDRLKIDKR